MAEDFNHPGGKFPGAATLPAWNAVRAQIETREVHMPKYDVSVRAHLYVPHTPFAPVVEQLLNTGSEPVLETEEQFEVSAIPEDVYTISTKGIEDLRQYYMWFDVGTDFDTWTEKKPVKIRARASRYHGGDECSYEMMRKQPLKGENRVEQEFDLPVTAEQFSEFQYFRTGEIVDKTRFRIPHFYLERTSEGDVHHSCEIHLDVFRRVGDTPVQFVRAEIEFPTTAERDFFLADKEARLPDWIGKRVEKEKAKHREHSSTHIALKGLSLTNGHEVVGVKKLYERLDATPFLTTT
jgi:CYTH domain-containing protein